MLRVVFIGDEVSAAGFRLAGTEVRVPQAGSELTIFQQALEAAELVIITAEIAELIPASLIKQTQISGLPLLLIIPDVRGHIMPTDIARSLRQQLGMAERD